MGKDFKGLFVTATSNSVINTPERTIISAFTGINEKSLRKRADNGWYSQNKGSKGNITLQGLQEQYGRVSAWRQRKATYLESQVVIVLAANRPEKEGEESYYSLKSQIDYTVEEFEQDPYGTDEDKKKAPERVRPYIVLGLATEESEEKIVPEIQQYIKESTKPDAKYEFVNIKKLQKGDKAEIQKLTTIIEDLEKTHAVVEEAKAVEEAKVAEMKAQEMEVKQQNTWNRLVGYMKTEIFGRGQTTAA